MTVRRALQMSLNVPAIAVLGKVGVNRLSARLTQAGAALVLPKGEAPGLAMGLGGVGIRLIDLVMLYTGLARQASALPLIERAGAAARNAAPAARSGRRLVCRQYSDRRAAAGKRAARPHRLQDRHLLRLSRRLGGRLRRPHDHRRLGRAAGRRAGAGPGRPRVGGADLVRCLRAQRQSRRRRCRTRPRASIFATNSKLPPPLQRFQRRRRVERRRRAAAHHVPARRRAARTGQGAQARSRSRSRSAGGAAPLTVMVNGVPLPRRKAAAARCSSRRTGRASCG